MYIHVCISWCCVLLICLNLNTHKLCRGYSDGGDGGGGGGGGGDGGQPTIDRTAKTDAAATAALAVKNRLAH